MSRTPKSYIIGDNRPVRIFESSVDFHTSDGQKFILAVAFKKLHGILYIDDFNLFYEDGDIKSTLTGGLRLQDQIECAGAVYELLKEHLRLHKEEMESWVDD